MSRIMIVDTLYPAFISSLPFDPSSTYEIELQKVLDRKFGTSDFYSRNLRALGWDAVDVIANHERLQEMWGSSCGDPESIVCDQIKQFKPDVLFLQDLSFFTRTVLKNLSTRRACIAAQCSCPWPGDGLISRMDIVFTSFPHYVKRIESLGVRAVYNPLGFEPSVLKSARVPSGIMSTSRQLTAEEVAKLKTAWEEANARPVIIAEQFGMKYSDLRVHDCVFIGGVGNPSHWKYGMQVLETVAREIPTFKWWGYGVETLPSDSALRAKYQGQAWGLDMYEILLQSKIVLNRHGEVAEGFANNMRMYEATGCGAMLLTDKDTDLFAAGEIYRYINAADAVDAIRHYLEHDSKRAFIAAAGQKRTLSDHTYAKRMQTVSNVLTEMLCPA